MASDRCHLADAIGHRRPIAAHKRLRAARDTGHGGAIRLTPPSLALAGGPRVLHVDQNAPSALLLDTLLLPAARITHVATLAQARQLLQRECFALVVLDPELDEGDAGELLPLLFGTPVLVYSLQYPEWGEQVTAFLPKRLTPHHQLWGVMAHLLGIDHRVPANIAC